jgi:hypothetical protein
VELHEGEIGLGAIAGGVGAHQGETLATGHLGVALGGSEGLHAAEMGEGGHQGGVLHGGAARLGGHWEGGLLGVLRGGGPCGRVQGLVLRQVMIEGLSFEGCAMWIAVAGLKSMAM